MVVICSQGSHRNHWQAEKRTLKQGLAAACLLLCAVPLLSSGADLGAGFVDPPEKTAPQVALGAAGVSSAHPLASQAGAEMLSKGGNAADAAVATGFALAVVENSMSGLGGRVQILLRDSTGQLHGIDGQTELGSKYRGPWLVPDSSGVNVVGVPGVVAGLLKLHETYGTLPLQEVMAPAIRFAKEGYPILPGEVARHQRVEADIKADRTLAAIYLNKKGAIRAPGELFQQTDLGNTLQAISEGGNAAFYQGDIARRIAEDLQSRGGSVTYEDLASYVAQDATLVQTNYRGFQVVGTTAPANGTAVVAALNVLSHFDMGELTDPEWVRIINQTMAQVMQATVIDDPDDVDYKATIGSERVKQYLREIDAPDADAIRTGPRRKFALPDHQSADMQVSQVDWSGEQNGKFSHHTTHYVAVDQHGMVVTSTQTLGPNFGAKVMTPGLGFLYAQTGGKPKWAANLEPGSRPRTNIAPVMVLKDGEPVVALGAAGGLMIPPAIVQVISRVIDQGYSLPEAVAAPRIAPKLSRSTARFAMDEAALEVTPINGWSDADVAKLESAGIDVTRKEKYSLLARVNAVMFDGDKGLWVGVADPDWEGSAAMVGNQ
jgi:gamma-glutamyltranspeptidase/glutathione hydrolase